MTSVSPAAEPQQSLFARGDRLLSTVGLRSAFSRDVVFAILVAVFSATATLMAVGLLSAEQDIVPSPAQLQALVAIVSVQSLFLVARHRFPIVTLSAVLAFQVVGLAVLPSDLAVQGIAPVVAAYSVGAHSPRKRANVAMVLVLVGEATLGALANRFISPSLQQPLFGVPGIVPTDSLLQVFGYLLLIGAPTYIGAGLVGRMVATRREYLALVELRASEAIEEQKQRADAAIAAERTRMARELHDIAAHHLSGIAVQAAAVERLVDSDPAAAKESIRWIRAQSKDTLANLRVAVGMLRESGAGLDDGGAPVPGLGVIDQLIEAERGLGASVTLAVEGEPRDLSPIADIAFYRVAQESFANARDHAPGEPVSVALHYGQSVSLEVRNPLRESSPVARNRGLGLVGMRERASLIGARFTAGHIDNEWVVSIAIDADSAPTNGESL